MIGKVIRFSFWAGVLALMAFVSAHSAAKKAFVLDTAGKVVVAVDIATGEVLAKIAVEGNPAHMDRTPDGSRLVVLDPGPGKMTVRFGFHPTGKASATIIDAATLAVVSRTELGWNLQRPLGLGSIEPPFLSLDGKRMTVLCPGYRSQKPEETLATELVTVDLESGKVIGRVTLERSVDALRVLSDGQTAVVFSARETPKKAEAIPAEVLLVDLSGSRIAARLQLDGSPWGPQLSPDQKQLVFFSPRQTPKKEPAIAAGLQFVDLATREISARQNVEGAPDELLFSPDGRFLYLLDKGSPDKKPEKNITGRVYVYSLETRAVAASHDAGTAPRGFIVDKEGGQLMLLSDGIPGIEAMEKEGELRVIRGAEVAGLLKVAAKPKFLRISPDRSRLYVVGAEALTQVDLSRLQILGATPLKPAGMNILAADVGPHTVNELALSDDGRRAFALYLGSSKLSILDLESRMVLGDVTTGRKGVKVGKFLGAFAASVAMTAASQAAAQSTAVATGQTYYTYQVYNFQIAAPNTSLAVRPDGKFAYALNTQSNDVTIVDASTGEVVDKIPGGGQTVRLFPAGKLLAVVDTDVLRFVDTATNMKGAELNFPGSSSVSLAFADDGAHAIAAGGTTLYCLDGVTGAVRASHTEFKKLAFLIVEGAAPRKPVI